MPDFVSTVSMDVEKNEETLIKHQVCFGVFETKDIPLRLNNQRKASYKEEGIEV